MKKRSRRHGHYFLEQRGLKHVGNETNMQRDPRAPTWRKERFKYGYDERFTWSLDYSMYLVMYETLCYYKMEAEKYVDLTHHTFELSKGKMNQIEAMDYLIEEFYWLASSAVDEMCLATGEDYEKLEERRMNIITDYGKVLPALWW